MKYITLAVAALLGSTSALKISTIHPSGQAGITGTNTGPAPGNPGGSRKMPAPIPGPMVKEVPPPGSPVCNDPFGTDLYVPYEHKPECMKPPLLPNMEHCPIDDKKMLTDGNTKAIPYPQPGGNCNPFGMWFQKSAPNSRVAFAQDSKNEDANKKASETKPTVLYEPNAPQPGYLKVKMDPMAVEHCPDFIERMTLVDGRTTAVPYPSPGFNCNPETGLAQKSLNK